MSLLNSPEWKYNVGYIDRLFRILIGITLMSLADLSLIGLWGWLGLIPFLTGIFRFCPLYSLLGIDTIGGVQRVK